ncbi:alpha/beta hydrolase-fold protein [Microbulbifer sp. M83]|uniref:alpha/beta hydrolase n=1 Tax=unclassified Microbulbifer TaxID=2619833 RepID=UPI002FDFB100
MQRTTVQLIFKSLLIFLLGAGPAIAGTATSSSSPFTIPRTETIAVTDPETQRNYELFIKLPRSYKKQGMGDRRYPVIYMTDAMYTFQVVSGATRYPMAIKKMEEAILVGVSWDKAIHSTPSRVRDYTPSIDTEWKLETGGAEAHLRFLRDTVFPTVEEHYPADPAGRTYVGNSLGGLLGAYALLKHTGMFRHYVLGSPSLWFDERIIFDLEAEYARKRQDLRARVYLSIGSLEHPGHYKSWPHDLVADADRFHRTLSARQYPGLELEYRVIEGADHETAFPTTAIQGLYWLFRI